MSRLRRCTCSRMTATSGAAAPSPSRRAPSASTVAVIPNSGFRTSWATPPTSVPMAERASCRCRASCSRIADSLSSSSSHAIMPTPASIRSTSSASIRTSGLGCTAMGPRPPATMAKNSPSSAARPRKASASTRAPKIGRGPCARRRRMPADRYAADVRTRAGARAHDRAPRLRPAARRRWCRRRAGRAPTSSGSPHAGNLAVVPAAPGPEQQQGGRPVCEDHRQREQERAQGRAGHTADRKRREEARGQEPQAERPVPYARARGRFRSNDDSMTASATAPSASSTNPANGISGTRTPASALTRLPRRHHITAVIERSRCRRARPSRLTDARHTGRSR